MNNEEYLESLRKRNGYCLCPELSELFGKRRATEKLEAKCNFFSWNVDLENPKKEDEKIIEDYRDNVTKLQKSTLEYYTGLTNAVEKKIVKRYLHNISTGKKIRELRPEEKIKSEEEFRTIFTYNCSKCDQQIDLSAI